MIYENATARHLGFARMVVFGLLLVRLLMDPVEQLADFPFGAFLPHGPLQFIPDAWMTSLLTAGSLLAFKWVYAGVLLLCLVGAGPRLLVMLTAICGTIFYDGLARGFGGHINHQELIVTHCAILLLFFPCYDGFSVNHLIWRKGRNAATPEELASYRLALRAVCFWIALTYFYVGLARISSSGVKGFFTNTINFYALQQSLRWGYWDVSLAKHLLDQKWLQVLLAVSFPLATLLELAAPLALFIRRLTIPIVLGLLVFHTLILFFMNFFFWQNMVLLLLFLAASFGRETKERSDETTGPGIIFYDGACGLCHRFVRWVARNDGRGVFRFAPLQGATAKEQGIVLATKPGAWSLLLKQDDWVYDRSTAALRTMTQLPGWSDVGKLLSGVPVFIRDAVYGFVARIRYSVFGVCILKVPPKATWLGARRLRRFNVVRRQAKL